MVGLSQWGIKSNYTVYKKKKKKKKGFLPTLQSGRVTPFLVTLLVTCTKKPLNMKLFGMT
jgi:hypothetical protein